MDTLDKYKLEHSKKFKKTLTIINNIKKKYYVTMLHGMEMSYSIQGLENPTLKSIGFTFDFFADIMNSLKEEEENKYGNYEKYHEEIIYYIRKQFVHIFSSYFGLHSYIDKNNYLVLDIYIKQYQLYITQLRVMFKQQFGCHLLK